MNSSLRGADAERLPSQTGMSATQADTWPKATQRRIYSLVPSHPNWWNWVGMKYVTSAASRPPSRR